MMKFKILAERLPIKWQVELGQALAGDTQPTRLDIKTVKPAAAIDVNADDSQIVDVLVDWIRKTNRLHKSEKTFAGQGINLKLEKADGARISLNERNGAVVKQFLMK